MRAADKIAARYAAREKQAHTAEQRLLNREAEQTALSAFEAARYRNDDIAMANAVAELANLGNNARDIGALTNQEPSEISRLRKLVPPQRNRQPEG